MDKAKISEIMEQISVLLELKGENPFKARAYVNAARALDHFDGDLSRLVAENRLDEIPGLGEALQQKITELVTTGKLEYYEKLRRSFPEGLLSLLDLPGLGPKKIRVLHEQLQIGHIDDLEAACLAQRVRGLTGFGSKTEAKILASIAQGRTYANQFRFAEAWARAETLRETLRQHDDVLQVSLAGSLRRGKEVVKDLDLVASSNFPEAVMDYFVHLPDVEKILNHGVTKSSVQLEGGMVADLRVVKGRDFPYALHHFTGSKEHNVAMRQRAIAAHRRLSEWGLFEVVDGPEGEKTEGALVPCDTETELFAALGLHYIPPELRENLGEIQAAEKGEIPRLLEWTQLRGTFHCHTTWSDGRNTLGEMAEAAQELGLEYMGIADHSRSSIQANGLDDNRLAEQLSQIHKLNQDYQTNGQNFRLFTGSEVDILKDGRLDFADDILQKLDYVVASVHNAMAQSEEEMTQRVIRAMENEYVTLLGHSTGRLLLQREPYQINLEKIIDCAAATGTWIELNCSSWRMDMDWRWWHRARDKGVKCSINPDAHRVEHFGMLRHGVTFARKGWLRREDVVNTQHTAEIIAQLSTKKFAPKVEAKLNHPI